MSYSDAFSKPGAIPWGFGRTKNEERLCPERELWRIEQKTDLRALWTGSSIFLGSDLFIYWLLETYFQ